MSNDEWFLEMANVKVGNDMVEINLDSSPQHQRTIIPELAYPYIYIP